MSANSGHEARLFDHLLVESKQTRTVDQRGSHLLKGKLNSAAHTLCGELQINCPPEFVGHEPAYQLSPVSEFGLNRYAGTVELAPCEHQVCRVSVQLAVPAHRHATSRHRQGAIFCSVGDQFVKNHSHGLNRYRGEHQLRSADRNVCSLRVGGKLVTNEGLKSDALPTLLTQQNVGRRHGLDAPIE